MSADDRTPRLLILVFCLILVLGGFLRVADIGQKSISHPEMYTPGIRMPAELSHPRERVTLTQVLTGTFSSDTHPPAYYVLLLYWTRIFGADLVSIRLPSVLFGLTSVLLLVWCGHLCGEKQAAWLAGCLLALHGPHAFWSQVARMYAFACFLGLFSTGLLLQLIRGKGSRRLLSVLYVLVTFVGVASHIYYWPLFLTQIAYVFLRAVGEREAMHGILRVQILALILTSLLLATSAYQSGNEVATLSGQPLIQFPEYLSFAYLVPIGFSQRFDRMPELVQLVGPFLFHLSCIAFAIAVLSVYFAIRRKKPEALPIAPWTAGPSRASWISAAVFSGAAILVFVLVASAYARPAQNRAVRISQAFVVLPFLVSIGGIFLEKKWTLVSRWVSRLRLSEWASDPRSLLGALAFGPFLVLSVLSLVRPALLPRGMTVYAPYLLLLIAAGLVQIVRRQRAIAVLIVVVLLGLHTVSLATHVRARIDPVDFHAFAGRVLPEILPGDTVLIHKEYGATPMLFYLKEERCNCNLVEMKLAEKVLKDPESVRVWFLTFYEGRPPEFLREALRQFRRDRVIEMPEAHAVLYVRHEVSERPTPSAE